MNTQLTLERFPTLNHEIKWGAIQCSFELIQEVSSESLVSNVNLVPFAGHAWILLRLQNGSWDIPGGTLERGESYLDAIRREILEEAGAHLIGFRPFGLWRCRSSSKQPFRPHIPHPVFHRLIGYGEVEIVAKPSNPAGDEQVIAVEYLPLKDVVERLRNTGRAELAELYILAAALRDES